MTSSLGKTFLMRGKVKLKSDVSIPGSAASSNLRFGLWFLAIGFVLVICHVPSWIFTLVFGISGGFLLSMFMCILDIQEFKMKQQQKIVELLAKIVNTSKDE